MVLWCCKGGGEGLNSVVGLRGIVGMLCGSELQVLAGCHYFDNRFKSFARKGFFNLLAPEFYI